MISRIALLKEDARRPNSKHKRCYISVKISHCFWTSIMEKWLESHGKSWKNHGIWFREIDGNPENAVLLQCISSTIAVQYLNKLQELRITHPAKYRSTLNCALLCTRNVLHFGLGMSVWEVEAVIWSCRFDKLFYFALKRKRFVTLFWSTSLIFFCQTWIHVFWTVVEILDWCDPCLFVGNLVSPRYTFNIQCSLIAWRFAGLKRSGRLSCFLRWNFRIGG